MLSAQFGAVHSGHSSLYVEYLCVTDCNKDFAVLQESETVNYRWVDRDALLGMSESETASKRTIKLIEELHI